MAHEMLWLETMEEKKKRGSTGNARPTHHSTRARLTEAPLAEDASCALASFSRRDPHPRP